MINRNAKHSFHGLRLLFIYFIFVRITDLYLFFGPRINHFRCKL